jgi:hypothetical protein
MPGFASRVILLAVLASQSPWCAQDGAVTIHQNPSYQETEYEIRSGSCRVRWIFSHSAPNRGVARHIANCGLPLKDQVDLNARILREVLVRETDFHTLFLGGLSRFPEAQRLSLEAAKSALWNSRSGRPRSGTAANFVVELANTKDIFAEWRRMFAQVDLAMKVASVEEVSLNAAKVPSDCLVWFALQRAQ